MKIAKIETYHIKPRWLFVRVESDDGLVGWGEAIVEGAARTLAALVEELSEFVVGQDPRRIEHIWQTLYRGNFYRGGPHLMSAISGIDQALWDIKGKQLGAPVHELLGGRVRDHVRMYAHSRASETETAVESARRLVRTGFDALKLGITVPFPVQPSPAVIDAELSALMAVRDAVGRDVDLAIDFHGRTSGDAAIALIRGFSDFVPLFIEEPVLPEDAGEMARVRRTTGAVIATGERLFSRWDFRKVIEAGAVSIVQPDLCHAGGISEVRRIASYAEAASVQVAPHNPLGPISLAACLQIAAASPNFLIQEHPTLPDGSDLGHGILREPFIIDQGRVGIPEGPGLGVQVDEVGLMERSYDGGWRTPQVRHPDGSVADW